VNRLEGKVAFVTGAGGGIGRAVCERFLAEGAKVAAADIDLEAATAAVAGAGGPDRAIALQCDAGDGDSVAAAIRRTVEAFGSLTVLTNIAGGSTDADGPVTEAPEDEFWRVIRLDLFGTFLVCKHGLPELIRAGGGSVINLTSVLALIAAPRRDCYTAAKGGVASLTRSMAAGYADHSIRVNAIAPGLTMTSRVKAMFDATSSVQGFGARHLLGPCEPQDIAHMAVYLASDESRVVTGQVLQVDSGVTIH
jgi:NAD(P)-dependent dehydrogenase (short-subunit alcohol dehydrogenase family)